MTQPFRFCWCWRVPSSSTEELLSRLKTGHAVIMAGRPISSTLTSFLLPEPLGGRLGLYSSSGFGSIFGQLFERMNS